MAEVWVDPLFQSQLEEMGFDPDQARSALLATQNASVQAAMRLLLPDQTGRQLSPPPPVVCDRGRGKHTTPQPSPAESGGGSDAFDFDDELEVELEGEEPESHGNGSDVKALDPAALVEAQHAEVSRLATLLNLGETPVRGLLTHFKWNTERLLERYLSDPAGTLQAAGMTDAGGGGDGAVSDRKPEESVLCGICGDEFAASDGSALSCGHWFCKECWSGFLVVRIREGDRLQSMTCMAFKCPCLVDEALVKAIVPRDMYDRYCSFVAKSMVDDSTFHCWCPAPGCGNAVRSSSKVAKVVKCSCGYQFCFACSQPAHAPVTCLQMKEWNLKCKDDSETKNWLVAHTNDCPDCHSPIEKNGGCNHMTCRKCNYQFCWLCLGDWRNHTSCNRYDSGKDASKSDHRASLERYLHYYNRWNAHEQSRKLESEMRLRATTSMIDMFDNGSVAQWQLVQYIDDATEQLIECRRYLMYTYVFAYFLKDGTPEKNIFEFLQEQLEHDTENLSHLLENLNVTEFNLDNRRKVVDLTRLAKRRLALLLAGVEQGFSAASLSSSSSSSSSS